MSGNLKAGIGRSNITPRVGAQLTGFSNRPGPSNAIHDDLYARAIVLDDGAQQVALCSVEMLWLRRRDIDAVRQAVAAQCPLRHDQIFVFSTHTHSGPAANNIHDWDVPLSDLIAASVLEAYRQQQPARVGSGFGFLYGYSINRRWLDRPVDPSVGVLRIDDLDGKPLGILVNCACHPVVLGYDNLQISGDYAGYVSRILEEALGPGAIALFSAGGAGNINPVTEKVRRLLLAGHPVAAIGGVSQYYGYAERATDAWNIGDRAGGTFEEAEVIGRAYADEALRAFKGITTQENSAIWLDQVSIEAAAGPDEPPKADLDSELLSLLSEDIGERIPLDIRLVGIGDAVLVGQPGEVFSETSVAFRSRAQALGYRSPILISYANGTCAYLPPPDAFPEGGYEVSWARGLGISRRVQDRIAAAIDPVLQSHAPPVSYRPEV